jgi:hypothetical protein
MTPFWLFAIAAWCYRSAHSEKCQASIACSDPTRLVETDKIASGLVEAVDQVDAPLQELEPKLDAEIAAIVAAGASPPMPFASQHPPDTSIQSGQETLPNVVHCASCDGLIGRCSLLQYDNESGGINRISELKTIAPGILNVYSRDITANQEAMP